MLVSSHRVSVSLARPRLACPSASLLFPRPRSVGRGLEFEGLPPPIHSPACLHAGLCHSLTMWTHIFFKQVSREASAPGLLIVEFGG